MEQLSSQQLIHILTAVKNETSDKNFDGKSSEEEDEQNRLLDVDGGVPHNSLEENREIIHGSGRYQTSFKSILARLKPIRLRYASSFTMHALDHIINGTRPEKFFWTFKLFIVISTAIFMCRELFFSYFLNKVDTNLMFKPLTKMKLPLVFVCGNNMERMLASQYDCTPGSRSYNETMCRSLNQKCPDFCKDDLKVDKCRQDLVDQGVTCDERLLGQCILLNGKGRLKQTLNVPGMSYRHMMQEKDFPLWVFVKPPGQVELMPNPSIEMKWTEINQHGNYHFSVEETSIKRLPYPYNKHKPCAEKGSSTLTDKNMFNGSYTIDKCLGTCVTRAQLYHCGTTYSISRKQATDQEALKEKLIDRSQSEIHNCVDNKFENITTDVQSCSAQCPTPCEEESYTTSVRYEPSEAGDSHNVHMFFYYLEMTEKMIEQAPSYVFSTLFANFGGTMGLMTGMSAISIIEMSIWFVMFLIDRCYRCKHKRECTDLK